MSGKTFRRTKKKLRKMIRETNWKAVFLALFLVLTFSLIVCLVGVVKYGTTPAVWESLFFLLIACGGIVLHFWKKK